MMDLISETPKGVTTKRERQKIMANLLHNTPQKWLRECLKQNWSRIQIETNQHFSFPDLQDIDITCGFPSSNARSNKNVPNSQHTWSKDGGHFISINPLLTDPYQVNFEVMVQLANCSVAHTMLKQFVSDNPMNQDTLGDTLQTIPCQDFNGSHVAVKCTEVARIVRFLGVDTKKPSQLKMDKNFKLKWGNLVDSLGKYPHEKPHEVGKGKKDNTRLIVGTCEGCGYKTYTVLKWLTIALPRCPNNSCIQCSNELSYTDSRVLAIHYNQQ